VNRGPGGGERSIFALFGPTHVTHKELLVPLARTPLLILLAFAAACSDKAPPPAKAVDSTPAKPEVVAAPTAPAVTDAPAPESFRVKFETSKGAFVVELTRGWSPRGVDRFNHLVQEGYFKDVRFFRVVPGFIAQFGMNGDPGVNDKWKDQTFADDPVTNSNTRGTVVFATRGANTRSNQLFINLVANPSLDLKGFTPIGKVVSGMNVVDLLFSGYGETPDQEQIGAQGNKYLLANFPKLDYIKSATVVPAGAK
jgi:peptidyl-prolyl cis-trans isomerase A (cyclophilin A)